MAPTLSILSWNLALLERPAAAPMSWSEDHALAAVREAILDRSPHVVLLQELPDLVPWVETHDMIMANPATHSGRLATLVVHELMEPQPIHRVVPGCAVLTTFPDCGLTVANVHLTPGAACAAERREQLAAVIEASPTEALVVGGDTNMRLAEERDIATLGLTGDRPPRPTWDSERNPFRSDGPRFRAYFTRVFVTAGVGMSNVVVHDEPIGPDDGEGFHLSDHYALSAEVEVGVASGNRRNMTD